MSLTPPADGTTPLTYDEADQLIPDWVETRGELNAVEALAIAQALGRLPASLNLATILDVGWLTDLHRLLFRDVWRWAGSYRRVQTSVGVEWHQILPSLHDAVADARLWFERESVDEAALRLHHRLVAIHPFPNGNGRWSRLVADLAVERAGGRRFSWGADLPSDQQRGRYLAALRAADRDLDVTELLAFARS